MSDKDLWRISHKVTNHFWWYEEPAGIIIVQETTAGTIQSTIPWRSIRAALRRKDK